MNMLRFVCLLLAAVSLAGCGLFNQSTPAPLPTVVLDDSPANGAAPEPGPDSQTLPEPGFAAGRIVASGTIVAADTARPAAASGGTVREVLVTRGEQVAAGQVIVRLAGEERLAAAVEAAALEQLTALQAVDTLVENADSARAKAQQRLALASDAFEKATNRRGWKEYRVGSDIQIDVARADLIVAEDALKKAEEVYGGYADSPEDNLNKAAALSALSAARTARDKARANLNYLLSIPDEIEVAKADAELEVARTEMEAAQREVERLADGPDPAALALAGARVKNAEAQLTAARAALDDLEIKAPIDGTVLELNIHPGEGLAPGQPVGLLADLAHLRVQTTDLSERDVPGIAVGQPAAVLVLPLDAIVAGRVSEIAPTADVLGGDVVYRVTVDLDTQPAGLRAGMSVEVQFSGAE